jgi:hypothetical protein
MADAHNYPPVAPVLDPPIPGNPIVAPVNANVAVGVNQAVFKMNSDGEPAVGSYIPDSAGTIPIEFVGVAMSSYTPRELHRQPPRMQARAKRHKASDRWESLAGDPATISVTVAGSATLSLGHHGSFMDALEKESLPVPGEWVAFDFSQNGVALVTRGGAGDNPKMRTHAPMVRKYDPTDRKQVPFGICLSYAATPRSEVTVLLRKDVFANDREVNGAKRRNAPELSAGAMTGGSAHVGVVFRKPDPFLHLDMVTENHLMVEKRVPAQMSGIEVTPECQLTMLHASVSSLCDTVMPWAAQHMLTPSDGGTSFDRFTCNRYCNVFSQPFEHVLRLGRLGDEGLFRFDGEEGESGGFPPTSENPVNTVDLVELVKSRCAGPEVIAAIRVFGATPQDPKPAGEWIGFMRAQHDSHPHLGWDMLAEWAEDSCTDRTAGACVDTRNNIAGEYTHRPTVGCKSDVTQVDRSATLAITFTTKQLGDGADPTVCMGMTARSDGTKCACTALTAYGRDNNIHTNWKIVEFTSILDLERTLRDERECTVHVVPMEA